MAIHTMMPSILVMGAFAVGAAAQTTPAAERWVPTNRAAQSTTGRVTFTTLQITFQNGKSLELAPGGE